MLDILSFLFTQLGNLFTFLDSFIIFGHLSFLRLFIVLFLFKIIHRFLVSNKN